MWTEWGQLPDGDERRHDYSERCERLAVEIVTAPVTTAEGLEAKRRIVECEGFDGDELAHLILRAEEERVAPSNA